MQRPSVWWIGFGALVLVGGCVREEPGPTPSAEMIVQQPAQPVAPQVAPGPPPPPHSELAPPPPQGSGPVVWQPGHWALANSGWTWQPGQYVPPPLGETTWVPGRWVQQSSGGWIWQEGHWA
jgi:WXXGXW repeat (2 copies)